mgnify:CR=1 FL=1
MFEYNPNSRITAEEALNHRYFQDEFRYSVYNRSTNDYETLIQTVTEPDDASILTSVRSISNGYLCFNSNDQTSPCGCLLYYENSFTNNITLVYLYVELEYREIGIGSELLKLLMQFIHSIKPQSKRIEIKLDKHRIGFQSLRRILEKFRFQKV